MTSGNDSFNTGHRDLESIQMLWDVISHSDGGSTLIYSFYKHLMSAYNMWHTQTGTRCTVGWVFLPWPACSGHQNSDCYLDPPNIIGQIPSNSFSTCVCHFSDQKTKHHHHKDTNVRLCTLASRVFYSS